MKLKIERAEVAFTVISLLFFMQGFSYLVPASIITVMRYGILAISCVVLLSQSGRVLWVVGQKRLFLSVVLLENLSFLWSDFPALTLSDIRSEMLPMSVFGIYLATRFTLKRQIEILSYALTFAIFLSFIVALSIPSIGISQEGLFKGIFIHKNITSTYGCLAAISFYSLTLPRQGGKFKAWLGFGLAIVFILATTSKTGLVLAFFLPSVMFLYSKLYLKGHFAVILSSLTILFVGFTSVLVIGNWDFLLGSIGGDPTLSGRTPMWTFMINKIHERPWLGYGRYAFWAPATNHAVEVSITVTLIERSEFIVHHAHNGFIELLLDVGLIGFLPFLVSFMKTYLTALRHACLPIEADDIWPLGFMILLMVNNVTESLLTYNMNLIWVLYVSLVFSINQKTRVV